MPQVKLMAVVVAVVMTAAKTAAMTAAMPAARGRIACGRECGGGERNHGNGGYEEGTRGDHGVSKCVTAEEIGMKRPARANARAGPSSRSA